VPIDQWHEVIADPTIADAVLDRLIHNAHRLTLKGDSMRKITAQRAKLDAAKKNLNSNAHAGNNTPAAFIGTGGRL
jgi:DNA replication protein DnaC